MGWIVMEKVGTKLASEKLSPSGERERGGRKDGGKKGWKSGRSLQPKSKKRSYWLNIFSARVFFFLGFERDCDIHSGSKEHMHCRRKNQSKEVQ